MALKTLPLATTNGPLTASDLVVIQAALAATIDTAWITATHDANVMGWHVIILHLDYVKGLETTVQVRVQGSADGGTTWRNLGYKATQGSGVSELTKDPLSLTPANYDTTDTVESPPYYVAGNQRIRVQFRGQGGSAPGTLAIGVSGGVLAIAA